MNSDTYKAVRKFWSERFGFEPSGEREEKMFLELAWVSVQNRKVLRQIERSGLHQLTQSRQEDGE